MLQCEFPTRPEGKKRPYSVHVGTGENLVFNTQKEFRDFGRKLKKYFDHILADLLDLQRRVFDYRCLCYQYLTRYQISVTDRALNDANKYLYMILRSAPSSFYWPFKHARTVYSELIVILQQLSSSAFDRRFTLVYKSAEHLLSELRTKRTALDEIRFQEVKDYSFALKKVVNAD